MRKRAVLEPMVMVGLRNPANMPRLLETGQLLAVEVAGDLRPFCAVGREAEAHSAFAERLYGIAQRACREHGAPDPLRVESRSFPQGVVDTARALRPSHLLLGFSPHREEDVAGEKAIMQGLRQVFRGVAGHLIVAHFGEPREIRRVLMPLASDLNLEPMAHLALALTRQHEGEVTLAHVVPEEATVANHHAASAFLRQAGERCGLLPNAQFRVETNNDVAEGILEMSWEYDAVIVGLPKTRTLADRILGSVADQVATWARCTSFLVRSC